MSNLRTPHFPPDEAKGLERLTRLGAEAARDADRRGNLELADLLWALVRRARVAEIKLHAANPSPARGQSSRPAGR